MDFDFLKELLPQDKTKINKELNAQIQAANSAKLAIPNDESVVKFSRYERHILRCLYDSLDRLDKIQQRRIEGLAGSIGEN